MPQVDKPWRPFSILVTSDTEWGARSLDSVLETNGYAVMRAQTGREALDLVLATQPHAVILDEHTPDMPGVEVCRLLTGDPRFLPTTPIIMTTSDARTRAQRMEAYGAGAWELYSRPFDGEMLLLKLQTFMRAKQRSERWREGSLVDGETGLYNPIGLARRAREIGAHAYRCQEAVACLALTVEGIADAPRADAPARPALEHVAAACLRHARTSDVIGRLSDTQLALIAPSTDSRGAISIVDRLRANLEAGPMLADRPGPTIRIRAEHCATPNYAESAMSVEDMLLQAASKLASQQADGTDGDMLSQP